MIPVTPRQTRLVRAPDLTSFRHALMALTLDGAPLDARDRLVVIPTRVAAEQLVRTIECGALPEDGAVVLPDFVTARELINQLGTRLPPGAPAMTDAEREVLLGVACRAAEAAGHVPPFRLRPGLLAEILHFYDTLRRHQKDVDAFERLALGMLAPGADLDRGAARLVQQTHFLVAAFREFERRSADAGLDEHQLRARLLQEGAARPYRHVVIAVGDLAFDRFGVCEADWDVLARVRGLERLDVMTTDVLLAGAPHERMHRLLPGIEEIRVEPVQPPRTPVLLVADETVAVHTARDREDEVAGFVRWIKVGGRSQTVELERAALVVHQPLPYMYVARELFRSAGVPCQMFDALPLAAEPHASALDLLCNCVTSNFAREPALALLRAPQFHLQADDPSSAFDAGDVMALDALLAEAGYLGDAATLHALIATWQRDASPKARTRRALRAAIPLAAVARELTVLREPSPVARQLDVLISFFKAHEATAPDEADRVTSQRARAAVRAILISLRDAYGRFDPEPVPFDEVAALVRRWIESHTFAPRTGTAGVHVLDVESARFGEFDVVQLAGLVDGEWPDRSRRGILYAADILRELGWPADADRREAARARFVELLQLPAAQLRVSSFSLELDAIVSPSPLLAELETVRLDRMPMHPPSTLVFEHEALGLTPPNVEHLQVPGHEWALHRGAIGDARDRRFRGSTDAPPSRAYSLSALERYQDCPFKFFAADVLRLEDEPEDQSSLTPRRRGQLLHEILQRFFEGWERTGTGAITPDNIEQAREMFAAVAEPVLATLPESESALERTRLFGSAISIGVADVVLGLEAERDGEVRERWLEYRLEGLFGLGSRDGPRVALRGVADRIDLLPGRRLRVIDYKSGGVPQVARALQAPVYALCAQERLSARDGAPWTIEEASYVSLAGRRAVQPVVAAGDSAADRDGALDRARARLLSTLAGIGRGEFPPRPFDPLICRSCAFDAVCRKDYVTDEP